MKSHEIPSHRPMCYRCFKPAATCLCDRITKVHNRTFVYIIQHMRERFHPIGTERIASLGLENVFLETVFPKDRKFTSTTVFPKGAALLYPAPNAAYIERLTADERPSHLVVIDGTWYQAQRIYRHSPSLQELPCLTFEEQIPSNYRIRMEPDDAANSTIEAVCRALKWLEPDTPGIDGLLRCFDEMITLQQALAQRGSGRGVCREKTHKPKLIPRFLTEGGRNLVIACGETSKRAGLDSEKMTLLTWNALRLSDRSAFKRIVQSSDADLDSAAAAVSEFREAWRDFLKPKDVLVTWNKRPMGGLFEITGPHREYFFLKAALGTLDRGRCDDLEQVLTQEGLVPTDVGQSVFDDKVALHLGAMEAVLTWLRSFSRSSG